jgi:hypothetical protein
MDGRLRPRDRRNQLHPNSGDLAHVDGILVMRNHLVVEHTDSIIKVDIGCHTRKHSTVHGINALGELAQGSIGSVSNELLGTLVVRKLEGIQSKGFAALVKCTWHSVVIRNSRFVIGVKRVFIGVNEFDKASHKLMDVAEVANKSSTLGNRSTDC